MIRGITFAEQNFLSEDFAHYMNFFLNDSSGITKGCEITNDGTNVTIGKGYFFVKGRFMNVEDPEVIDSTQFTSGYNRIVYEIDMTKENTISEFLQGYIKILTTEDLIQENLDGDGNVYQFPFCHFTWNSTITNFTVDAPTLILENIMAQIEANFATVKEEFETWFSTQQDESADWIADQKLEMIVWTNLQKEEAEEYLGEKMNELNEDVEKAGAIVAELEADGFEKKALYYSATMYAANWNENTYSFQADYPFAEYDIEIQPANSCTEDQFDAWCEAKLVGSMTSNRVMALGVLPEVDIPIILKAVKKYA